MIRNGSSFHPPAQDRPEMFTVSGHRRKLIVFTEHKDTLNYLKARISDVLANPQAVRVIYGGTNRDDRRKIQEEFRNDPGIGASCYRRSG